MLNWISSACIVLAGQAGPLYVNTTISMVWLHYLPTTLDRGWRKIICILQLVPTLAGIEPRQPAQQPRVLSITTLLGMAPSGQREARPNRSHEK